MKNHRIQRFGVILPITLIGVLTAVADDLTPATAPKNMPNTVPNYQVAVSPANIAPTPATQPPDNIQVYGQPKNVTGHPCTLVDSEDIQHYKDLLKDKNSDIQAAFQDLKTKADKRLTQDLDVPIAEKAPDGSWMFPGEFPLNVSPFDGDDPKSIDPIKIFSRFYHTNNYNADSVQFLGMMYQVTGDAKYGEYARKILLGYADNYNKWGHPKDWTPSKYRSATDGRLNGIFLGDGFYLNEFAYGYDLVHDLPSWTPAERAHVRDDFFKPVVAEFIDPVLGKSNYISLPDNRSCICTAGVLMAGYACEDQEMINEALYGPGGTKEKPTGGLIKVHFGDQCLLPDGLWIEGSPSYQLSIAAAGLFNDAETLWRHGIDMYRYRNGALKRMLDTSFSLAYPDKNELIPALRDANQFGLLDSPAWLAQEVGVSYELGYERYKDPRYLPLIRREGRSLMMATHEKGPSPFIVDLPPAKDDPAPKIENANFYSTGYGILRQPTATGGNQLLLEYGTSGGHGHPSKLGIDVYALGKSLMPFPGVIYPYNHPLDGPWFGNTISNCAMMVDELSQAQGAQMFAFSRGAPTPVADQLVYGPALTMGLQRAWSNTLYAIPAKPERPPPPFTQVEQDRSLFLTPEYLADLYAAFSTAPHKYDLVWHIMGQTTPSLKTEPFTFPDPVPHGYNVITNLTHASSDQPWTATITTDDKQTVRFLAAGGNPTDLYFGNRIAAVGLKDQSTPPVFIQRRDGQNNTIFGNAVDLSGQADGYLKSVAQEGSLDTGYGLLKLTTAKGTDLCFTAFRPGSYTAEGLTTDALQAMVKMDGTSVSGMYLGGGTTLKVAGGSIQRSEPGLAYVEKLADGSYVICNPSPTKATITVNLSALGGEKKLELDAKGQWSSATGSAK